MKNKKQISKVNLINKYCWCGESKVTKAHEGIWSGLEPIKFTLGKCVSCQTLRTIYSGKPKVNYDNECVYETLSNRHYKALKIIKKYSLDGSILDIGCSSGLCLLWLKENCNKLTKFDGIDLNKESISLANNPNLKVAKIEDVKEKYNNILLQHTLEHIKNLKSFFKEIRRISIKGKTRLHIFVPNFQSYNAKKNLYNWGALNPTQHCWHFDSISLFNMIKHFLPDSKIIHLSDSWIWKPKTIIRFIIESFYEKDQIEMVVEL